jgi:hypothetical protein
VHRERESVTGIQRIKCRCCCPKETCGLCSNGIATWDNPTDGASWDGTGYCSDTDSTGTIPDLVSMGYNCPDTEVMQLYVEEFHFWDNCCNTFCDPDAHPPEQCVCGCQHQLTTFPKIKLEFTIAKMYGTAYGGSCASHNPLRENLG